ncbi:MAG: hypothetical protein AAF938_20745 [Myxococcota bacterium]
MLRRHVLLFSALVPTRVLASDFWDEVREPGLIRFRRLIEEATIALRGRRLADVERIATEALSLLPDRPEPRVLRGLAHAGRGATQSAVEDLQAALATEADAIGRPWTDQAAAVLVKGGALEDAAGVLARALRVDAPSRSRDRRFLLLAHVTLALGRGEAAVDAYRETMRSGQGSPAAWLGLALALRRTDGSRAEADELVARAAGALTRPNLLALDPDLPTYEIAAREAILMEQAGDRLGAQSAWDRAREGPYSEHARAQSAALQPTPSRRRRR